MMTTDAKFWDRIAEKYAAKPVDDVPAFERKQHVTREHVDRTSTVLEIGCGTGSLALAMYPFVGHVHAMDISAEMVRIANHKKQVQGVTNVTFHQGTLDQPMPWAPARFDSIWAYSLLHLVADRRRTLSAVFQLLAPGGTFISSNLCLNETWVPYGPMITVMRWLGKAPFVSSYDRRTMFHELGEAGFVDAEEKDVGAAHPIAFVVAKKPA